MNIFDNLFYNLIFVNFFKNNKCFLDPIINKYYREVFLINKNGKNNDEN